MINGTELTYTGDRVQETTSYIVTTLFGNKIEFSLDACISDNYIHFILFDINEDRLKRLVNNLSRAYRNKFIGCVKVSYECGTDVNNMKNITIDVDGSEEIIL